MKRVFKGLCQVSLFGFALIQLMACGTNRPGAEAVTEEVAALRKAFRSGAPLESLLAQRLNGLYAKQQSSSKSLDKLIPRASCTYQGDPALLQACYDQAVSRLLALPVLENNVSKFNLTTGKSDTRNAFVYQVKATNSVGDGMPATLNSVFTLGEKVPTNFYGNGVSIAAQGPRFMFAAIGMLLGATDGQTLAGGGVGAAFAYLDVNTLMVYYGAAGCAGGAINSGGTPTGDAVCGVVPVAAVPLIP